jgi:methylated-DNA-[protein]-cysteine S-methyltransferase
MTRLHYLTAPSPIGRLTIGAGDAGIYLVGFGTGFRPEAPGFEFVKGSSALATRAREELGAFFEGDKRTFDLPVSLGLASPFAQRILKLLMEVPYGELTTYGALAAAAGSSARAVGGAVGSNPIPVIVPCHRVVAADGSLGGFSGGLDRKRKLLAIEGHDPLKGGWEPRRRKVLA